MNVPLLDLTAQYQPLRDEILAAMTRVCDSQRFILGPETEGLERELAAALGVRHAVAVSSGTDALLVALMAVGVGAGDEVITSTYSFFATAGCVVRLGARPVLVDIEPESFNLDPAAVARALTPATKAIVPVHLFGQSAQMRPLLDIANRAGVAIVEDACQAIGATYFGQAAGAMGALGCFSFFPSKNLGGFGDGGLVTTNDSALADEVRLLRGHGAERRYYHRRVGGNFRLDELQAAVLRVKAPHLAGWTAARQRNALRYAAMFQEYGLTDVVAPRVMEGCTHIYNQFVIRAPRRDGLRDHLRASGIGAEVYYPVPFHRQECFAALAFDPNGFPQADRAAADSLALPIYGELTEAQQRRVVSVMAEYFGTVR